MIAAARKMRQWFDRFLFESCDPNTCVMMRLAYAALLILYVVIWMLDGSRWFSDSGVMTSVTAQRLSDVQQWSLFHIVPATPTLVSVCLAVLLAQSCLLLLGVFSRFQAACIFFWLVSFQHRNPLICDGEDTVFRLLALMLVFLPLDHAWSLSRYVFGRKAPRASAEHAWGLRIIQVEMTAIYLSAVASKLLGSTWRDGSALYYVSRMDDLFGRAWVPDLVFDTPWMLKLATWSVLAAEMAIPIGLWFRPTRRLTLGIGIGLHLLIEYSMHLFLFEWIMIVGLLSFARPHQWILVRRLYGNLGEHKARPQATPATEPRESESDLRVGPDGRFSEPAATY